MHNTHLLNARNEGAGGVDDAELRRNAPVANDQAPERAHARGPGTQSIRHSNPNPPIHPTHMSLCTASVGEAHCTSARRSVFCLSSESVDRSSSVRICSMVSPRSISDVTNRAAMSASTG